MNKVGLSVSYKNPLEYDRENKKQENEALVLTSERA